MSYAPRRFEDDIYPDDLDGVDDYGHWMDDEPTEPDPDMQRDLMRERAYDDEREAWIEDALVAADDEARWLEEGSERMWAEARLQDVKLRYASPVAFIASLGTLDTEWKQELSAEAAKVYVQR